MSDAAVQPAEVRRSRPARSYAWTMSSRSGVAGVEVAVVAAATEDLAEKARRGSRIESGGRRARGGIGRVGRYRTENKQEDGWRSPNADVWNSVTDSWESERTFGILFRFLN